MPMTSDAKSTLSTTIRSLRGRLLDDLHAGTESIYRLSVPIRDAGLDEAARVRRGRLEAWVAEQLRAQGTGKVKSPRSAEDFRREAEKQAAYTFLNRIVLLRLMEAPGPSGEPIRMPAVVTGGWESRAYKDFRQLAPNLVRGDATEGYDFLLQLVFEDLATELPGLYGPAGVAELIPIPAATLRHVVDALNLPELESCWTDDMTLGWVYQYWNDPERKTLDDKVNSGGKIEPHEIASKTQMFTERYMVDWLLQNSLCPMWLAMCEKHGWTPEVESNGTLQALEARRVEWRVKRKSGEVEISALMPLHNAVERHWAYYVPQPIPGDAAVYVPDTVRDLKLIDPAVGSGHFLVVALDLLVALYKEEARHRGEAGEDRWTDRAIVERILGYNLHGIDLDPRAVQIAAAALWLKARQVAPDARPEHINLVASNLRLASLRDDDPALVELRREIERDTGIPGMLTDTLVHALRGADHLGSLLKIDHAVDEALTRQDSERTHVVPTQGNFFTGFTDESERKAVGRDEARATLLDRIERFLSKHTSGDDLGLRLRGQQLAAGVRFVRLVREGTYDVVVANPPYQGTAKMADTKYIEKAYPLGKADLYAAFLLRGLELVRQGGVSAMLTMRNWLYLGRLGKLRSKLFENHRLHILSDLGWGAFSEMKDVKAAMTVFWCRVSDPSPTSIVAPAEGGESGRTLEDLLGKQAGLLCHGFSRRFSLEGLRCVEGWPVVYAWTEDFLAAYSEARKLSDAAPVRIGLKTSNNERYVRYPFEVPSTRLQILTFDDDFPQKVQGWVPFVQGASGRVWIEPVWEVVQWSYSGLQIRLSILERYGSGPQSDYLYFRKGVACSTIGNSFTARQHRFRSIFSTKGTSVFPSDGDETVCLLNSESARRVVQSLNPGTGFEVGDINRIPYWPPDNTDIIGQRLREAFTTHESHRETSVEFKGPGPSPWRHSQEWAQASVDRSESAPLREYVEVLDHESPTDHLSFAFGVALGRFGANGEGILDPATADLSHALPHGILFLDTTLDATDNGDGLGYLAAAPLHAAWAEHGAALCTKRGLRDWLAMDFFKDVHKGMYENRPIHWPISSLDKTFVAWINIHRFNEQTLRVLLADHLLPTLARIDGELNDLRAARDGADKKAARAAEKQFERIMRAKDELQSFIANVEQCSDLGAPHTDNKCPSREQDARYAPDLDDGVMINSAALWPLLYPQWKDPKKWWKELATANGRKDYDWSHLAMLYWPTRVDKKCQNDPSLGAAHGCFWRYHPDCAWAWELRLQDEIGTDFRIKEAPYRPGGRDLGDTGDESYREAWLRDYPIKALTIIEKEAVRRMGRGTNRKAISEMHILETGLWSRHAADVWEMELRLSERQGSEVRLLAPDEAEARAAFEMKHPEKVDERQEFLANLVPHPELFEGDEEDTGDDYGLNDVEEDEEAES